MNPARVAAEIEHIEAEAWAQLHLALPSPLRAQLQCEVKRCGPALSVRTAGADSPSGNRTVGLGLESELTEDQLSAIVAWYAAGGIKRWLLDWSPDARPRAAETWIARHGGRAMTPTIKLWRRLERRVPSVEQGTFVIVEIGRADASIFEETVAEPLGVLRAMAPVVRATIGQEHWHFYLALDGTQAIAGAAMFVRGAGAWLGLSATLPSHRNRGAQTALLTRRLRDAAALGSAWVSADTQPDTEARPNPSYRNMRRAGMDVLYSRPKYLFEPATPDEPASRDAASLIGELRMTAGARRPSRQAACSRRPEALGALASIVHLLPQDQSNGDPLPSRARARTSPCGLRSGRARADWLRR